MKFFEKRNTTIENVSSVPLPTIDVFGNNFTNIDLDTVFTETDLMNNSDVQSVIQIIASDIAGLDLISKVDATEDVLELLNNKPNPFMTAYSMKFSIIANLILKGNSFIEIIRNEVGRAIELIPIESSRVNIQVKKNEKYITEIAYIVNNLNDGKQRIVKYQDMLHFKMLSTDGIVGKSPLKALSKDLSVQKASKEFINKFWKNGTNTGGILKTDESLDAQTKMQIKAEWVKTNGGTNNAGAPAVIDRGFEYDPLKVETELLKLVSDDKNTKLQVAQVLGIPPHKIGIQNSNLNIAELNQDYLVNTLKSYLDLFLSELHKLDTQIKLDFDFNVDAYKNIDTKLLHENIKIERELGLISVDDARTKLGYKPLNNEIGKQFITNLNFVDSTIANQYQLDKSNAKGGAQVDE
ncbi:phage portal protein [Macrococcoides caseolyticum]|uniref:phage portal protein n=1 Tax=Macrococcoides caseolyticum TaxID=69966 RepID=UPI001F2C7915|nr:phage portal protein [Macrococcus caseolyticus]MCE4957263.1 phage portal protein [Macrococcus caseolyticus]